MILKKIIKRLIRQEWNIGFLETNLNDVVSGKKIDYLWMTHGFKKRWFADPFLLDVLDDSYIILAEDFCEQRGYAVISELKVCRKTGELLTARVVLDVGSHLSFPFIIRRGCEIYVLPENSASGRLSLYKRNQKGELEFERIVVNEPLTDAVLHDFADENFLFATSLPNPNGSVLSVFERIGDEYIRKQSIEFDCRIARMAGDFFETNSQVYRVAQDSSECYGGALWIQSVNYENNQWTFKNVRCLKSEHPKLKTGLHTFNTFKGVSVVDVHGYVNHPRLSAALTKIINLFRTLR